MSGYFDRVERQIVQRVEAGVPRTSRIRPTLGHLALAAAVLVVIVVAGVFLAARGGTSHAPAGPVAGHAVSITLAPTGTPTAGAIERTVQILRARLAVAVPKARVSVAGGHIVINDTAGKRAELLALSRPGRLAFYDWERDALTPNGKTVASQLAAQNPTALEISQGNGSLSAGDPGAGSMSWHQAMAALRRVGRGARVAIVRAIEINPGEPTSLDGAGAQFYVLQGPPSLRNADLTNPRARTDPTGGPDVTFDFTAAGGHAFQTLTAAVARRGSLVSGLGQSLNQHFAIALDGRLLTVPYIDYKQYPDGIPGDQGADIAGSFTTQAAKDLAILLRFGPLPVNLTATG